MSPFRIIGDTIEYDFVPVARFIPGAIIGKVQDATDDIWALDLGKIEAEQAEEIDRLEEEHKDELKTRDDKIGELETRVADLEKELDALSEGGLAARLAELKADAARWKSLAQTYADKTRELQAPKPRKRRAA